MVCNSDHNLDQDILHEGGGQKAQSKLGLFARKHSKQSLPNM